MGINLYASIDGIYDKLSVPRYLKLYCKILHRYTEYALYKFTLYLLTYSLNPSHTGHLLSLPTPNGWRARFWLYT